MKRTLFALGVLALVLGAGCREKSEQAAGGRVRLVLKIQPLWGEPGPFRTLLEDFQRRHPEAQVDMELLPNASDVAHQFYLTSLEGGSREYDVLVVDVIWVQEFAKAGWVADLTEWFPPQRLREEFLPGPVEAVVREERTYAVPWFVDVGLLYWRTDLVPRAPRTYEELQRFAREAMAAHPGVTGYVWQGRQYEGLNCNVYEAFWGHGGESLGAGGRLQLDTEAGREALAYLQGLRVEGLSPPGVTSAGEEEARRVFQAGGAVFMRNWPYAWRDLQSEHSAVRGKVGVAALPTSWGGPGPGALGGWQLAVNGNVPEERRRLAAELVRQLTSPEANLLMALHYARMPARRGTYEEERMQREAPFLAGLREAVELARPRPVTPYYNLIADVLQSEFSAAISGLRTPAEALRRAQKQVDRIMGQEGPGAVGGSGR